MAGPAPEHIEWVRRMLGQRSDAQLRELERDAAARGIPILGPAAAGFVAGLARLRGAREILELGAATGYTAIWLGRVATETGGRVTTVERDAGMVREARANLAKAGLDGAVQVVEGDALAFLQEPGDGFELILLDIDKAEYAVALPACVERLRPRGVLVADNVTFAATREFQSVLLSDERLDTSLLYGFWPGHAPEWDTLTVSVKRLSGAGARVGPLG
ncbi:MAG TPA: class I SAM-dependent methyltransferase [Candidatus Thermoplasmatota archaeon]|nr:class I SAM-dependent methyltransferase [Candidatus Thermoplasmatota archaeon]